MKGKKEPDLIGQPVMVHPDLTTDPAARQGQMGKIIAAFPSQEVLYVEFNDGVKSAYLSDALLILYPKETLLQGVLSNPHMDKKDRELVLRVHHSMVKGDYTSALQLAGTNDTTFFYCTTNCRDWMELNKENRQNRKTTKQQRRPKR